ncbi:MAG: hypothetical protein AAF682_27900 [Planctomycetota bacterium]
MERLSAIGLSWRHGELDRVARFTVEEEERPRALRALAERLGAEELVYVATCNRVEVVFVRPEGTPLSPLRARVFEVLAGRPPTPGETERTFRAWSGEGAVEHLFLVAAGLDSAQLGETEITGQVRRSMAGAREEGLLGARLGPLFEEALRLARRVRSRTSVGEGRTSLAELALDAVRGRLAHTPGRVALVGVSPMTERCGEDLARAGVPLVVVNRSLDRAAELARRLGGEGIAQARALDDFCAAPDAVAALVSATAAPGPVLGRGALERLVASAEAGHAPLVVDLAVPPDVAPEDARALELERVDMQELTDRAAATSEARRTAAGEARLVVDDALERWRRSTSSRALAPVLAALQRHYQSTARAGVERLMRRELAGLGADERAAVERWAEALARRFAHLPSAGLRELAAEHGADALRAFFRHAEDDLARELEATPGELLEELAAREEPA